MKTPIPEKPSDYLKEIVTKENLSKLNKTVKEGIETAVDAAKQMFKWFSEVFTKLGNSVKEKGLKATLFGGPLIGLLNELSPDKKLSSSKEKLGSDSESSSGSGEKLKTDQIAKAKEESKKKQDKIRKQVEQDQEAKEIANLSVSDRIKWAIGELIGIEIPGKHCWDWVEKVYANAGVQRKMIFNVIGKYTGKDCGKYHADPGYLRKALEYGDHLYVNNQNLSDDYGNHSVIFIGWIDEKNLIAKTASCPRAGKPGQIDRPRDLKKHRVTRISKPVA